MIRTILVAAALALSGCATLPPPEAAPSPASVQTVALEAYAAPDRELMVPVEGGNVYVRVNGDLDAAPPVVFLHGGPGGTHNGLASMLGLADERAVVLYDQLDSGKSDHPNDPANWRVERFVEELETIRRTLGIERWHVVGHSWGSAIALEYAAKYPQHVASTVLGGTYINTERWIADANILLEDLPQDVQQTIAACETDAPPPAEQCAAATDAFYAEFNRREPATAALRAYSERIGGQGFNPVIYNAMWGPSEFRSKGSLKTYDAVPLLGEIDGSRTLFLIGQYDEARIDTVQDYVKMTPGAEFGVVPGAAHGFFTDRPMESEAILRAWLARHDAP
ncbi:proline iminopeptidase-family hydrolase [Citromicrobium bathyomarinum]|uniref:proline iminopeptidase-family hydrolase n=1 Tax=Citromicrobium bathyomarinum TaxID=72174 RepID=UPI001E568673|nr:proline iminopeptidase-family hydrolase [Citromicrobium bathyomarinum]MCD1621743.1 proline iminopeptidase-family hydrolase [Citromicrobium bathyomarinum]